MPHIAHRLLLTALLALTGCATPNFLAGPTAKSQADGSGLAKQSASQSATGRPWTARPGAAPVVAEQKGTANALTPDRLINDLLVTGTSSREAGDLRTARSAFEQALRMSPNNAYANYQLAMIDDDQGRFTEAENHYLAVLKQSPDHPADVLASMGWSYQLQGRYDDSERALQEALRHDPNHQTALYNLGWLYGNRGDYDRALAQFRRAGSEAQAQQALAELQRSAGGRAPAIEPAYAAASQNSPPPAGLNQGTAGTGSYASQIDTSNPKAKKFIEDYQQKLAEQNRQRELWNQNAARGVAGADPWKNGRGTVGQRGGVAGTRGPVVDPRGAASGRSDQNSATGQYVDNAAAFAGSAPTQANQARQADSQFVGNQPAGIGMADPRSIAAQNLVYEQTAVRSQSGQPAARGQYPVITPGAGAATNGPAAGGPENGSWNSLPSGGVNPTPMGGRSAPPDIQTLEWTPASTGSQGYSGAAAGSGAVINAVGPAAGGSAGTRNPWQDAQATAAQLGLSAGPGGLGLPLSDWQNGTSSQQLQNSAPANSNGARTALQATGAAGWPQGPNSVSDPRQLQSGPQQSNQMAPGGATLPSPTAPGLPPWPGRPLGAGVVQAPVVPSAQGMVYGSTDQSPLPSLNSLRTTNARPQ
jgi:Tfp pilus assembly protein PilF